MKTIYISKSKVGKHDDLMLLREMLSTYDCEVTEFIGGKYSNEKLLKADILIVLPHMLKDDDIPVGKGQYDEIENFDSVEYKDNIFVVTTIDYQNKEILLHQMSNYSVNNSKDWTHYYGTLETDSGVWELPELMWDHFEIPLKGHSIIKPSLLLATIKKKP